MEKYFTKTFFRFFFVFIVIIGVAFSVLIFTAAKDTQSVDNIAAPR